MMRAVAGGGGWVVVVGGGRERLTAHLSLQAPRLGVGTCQVQRLADQEDRLVIALIAAPDTVTSSYSALLHLL